MAKPPKPPRPPRVKKPKREPTAQDLALAARKPQLRISRLESTLMHKVGFDSFALYVELAWHCDARTGIVHGTTYDYLRGNILNDNLEPIGRANLRICLLELDDVGLIVFDRATPTPTNPHLGITVPHQIEAGKA